VNPLSIRALAATWVLVLWPAVDVHGQSAPPAQKRQTPDTYPPALPHREGPPPPALTFVQLSEIPLPGPVSTEATQLEDGTIRLPVREGWAILTLEPELSVKIVDVDPAASTDDDLLRPAWVVSPDGRFRYTTFPEGMLRAERHRSRGWKKVWKLEVAASTPAPPTLAGDRLLFGALDNQVHAVRSANGHRLWASDVGGRVSHPLTLWRNDHVMDLGFIPQPIELVLLVPDFGASVIALDTHDGSRLATLELPREENRILPPVLVTADGKIVIAVQRYDPADAALVLYELKPPDIPTAEDQVAYNEQDRPGEGAGE
jgi:outer membrane protein assembly factor BamB